MEKSRDATCACGPRLAHRSRPFSTNWRKKILSLLGAAICASAALIGTAGTASALPLCPGGVVVGTGLKAHCSYPVLTDQCGGGGDSAISVLACYFGNDPR